MPAVLDHCFTEVFCRNLHLGLDYQISDSNGAFEVKWTGNPKRDGNPNQDDFTEMTWSEDETVLRVKNVRSNVNKTELFTIGGLDGPFGLNSWRAKEVGLLPTEYKTDFLLSNVR